jgi:hypothetical protein
LLYQDGYKDGIEAASSCKPKDLINTKEEEPSDIILTQTSCLLNSTR